MVPFGNIHYQLKGRAVGNMKKIVTAVLILAMALCLCSCGSTDYSKAVRLLKKNQFDEAAELFESLGDYKDAKDHLEDIPYLKAKSLLENGDYAGAEELFLSLGEYKDSSSLAEEAHLASKMQEAQSLLDAGKYSEAYQALAALKDYPAAEEILKTDENMIREATLAPFHVAGNVIRFGVYEQDGDTANGKEPIEWLVLNAQGNEALLLSRVALSKTPYNKGGHPATWETCSLRSWLNEEFYHEAFSDEEKTAILLSAVSNGIKEQLPLATEHGSDTMDRVFLLSYHEVRDYLQSDYLRCCEPSAALAAHGTLNNWYTRSPGEDSNSVRVVASRSGALWTSWLDYNASFPQMRSYNGVRPCIRVDLSSELFADPADRLVDCENRIAELDVRIRTLATPSSDLVGRHVAFGRYVQEENSPEPIDWTILDIDDGYALLLSDKVLEYMKYLSVDRKTTWEESKIRAWLNNEFLSSAFSEEEIAEMRETLIRNTSDEGRPDYIDGGNDTLDTVFLLSYQDTEKYLPTDNMRECAPSSHAVQQGAANNVFGLTDWWLRSAGEKADEAIVTYRNGCRISSTVNSHYGIRPAIWVSVDALDL